MILLATFVVTLLGVEMQSNSPVQSNAQAGGVTAGSINTLTYYAAPPVTDQEQEIAVQRLRLTLQELATYRERPADIGNLTKIEQIRTEKMARRLYIALSSFFDPTIVREKNGQELLAFKRRYNLFVRSEAAHENDAVEYFGRKVASRSSAAWRSVFHYSLLRIYRGSKEATVASGMDFFEIGPDDSEVQYQAFIADKSGGAWLPLQAQEQEELISTAYSLLAPFDQSSASTTSKPPPSR